MKSRLPKVLHPIAHRPMVEHVLSAVTQLQPARTILVIAPGMEARVASGPGVECVVQKEPLGTGHAVMAAATALESFIGDIVVLYGDTPLVTPETVAALLAARGASPEPAVVVAGMRRAEPGGYARLVTAADGSLEAIVEARDCSEAERLIDFLNAGPLAADGTLLFSLLRDIGRDNSQREYYLTSVVAAARRRGLRCATVEVAADEMTGANDRVELAAVESLMQQRLRRTMMLNGVGMLAPETVFLAADTRIGADTTIGPYVVFGPGVTVGREVEIAGFCHITGAVIADRARVGPFARLRPGADLGEEVHVGNFVEVKNARLARGAKANHLSYIGDAAVGARTNIGAGTITCNYDGVSKHRTEIGADVFVGTNSALVAPVTIADGAIVAAGSVITDDVPADALALGRGRQVTKPGRAAEWRRRHPAPKKKERGG